MPASTATSSQSSKEADVSSAEHAPYILVDHVTKQYGDFVVVDDMSFTIAQGGVTAIIGPNGAGKSTVIKMIMGLIRPDEGTITIHGQTPRVARTTIGYVPQRFTYQPHIPMTVEEFLLLSLHVAGKHHREQKDVIAQRFEDVGLTPRVMQQQLSGLSGGQLQRMLIARALLTEKELLVMDEPVASLDIEGRESIHELLQSLNKKHGVTVLLVSHELEVVTNYADTVLCLNKKLLCKGRPQDTLTEEVLIQMYGIGHQAHYHHSCATDHS